ncbi:hypothetical protein LBMAG21_03490 [Armatimonadota bacterium]|nr:hypothetical protein LBMAG21_03490 [Armatimonadota bacterium]
MSEEKERKSVAVTLSEPKSKRAIATQNPSAPRFFANNTNIFASQEEVVFVFSQRDIEDPNHYDEVTRIILTPSHAKRLNIVLKETLARLEGQLGYEIDTHGLAGDTEVLD